MNQMKKKKMQSEKWPCHKLLKRWKKYKVKKQQKTLQHEGEVIILAERASEEFSKKPATTKGPYINMCWHV